MLHGKNRLVIVGALTLALLVTAVSLVVYCALDDDHHEPYAIPGVETYDEHRFTIKQTQDFASSLPEREYFARYIVDKDEMDYYMMYIRENVQEAAAAGGCLALGKGRDKEGRVRTYLVAYKDPAKCPK
ncbi:hypothetical protein GOARA_082_00880 [Gordonia araii NBRC 100433]|uniref:Uncharacterized protein n=1 Tax=Gordonia araii NBRC 100433 TaxID=1073574 RepID=G7H774_9ACTN|nr:hypothetical protein [Gordonia araii]NNG97694.1 hypothetical protein [Gordonia araii NBRC 100433]GAB11699.1 hypothetical protein GOARA_082_00880 [Gordonia araii NBRC 100433]